ncbi:MAG TPA: phage tail tube protein [Alphaproteobacteria bacterium]|nr:phage tail tube protein [Alphaproteobacteria bacterium]
MTKYVGRNAGVYLGTGTAATLVAHVKTTSAKLDGAFVDVTDMDSGGFREGLSAAGEKSADLTVTGPVSDGTGFAQLVEYVENGSSFNAEFRYGNSRRLYGPFIATNLQIDGNEKDAQTFSMTLQSAGTFLEGTLAA